MAPSSNWSQSATGSPYRGHPPDRWIQNLTEVRAIAPLGGVKRLALEMKSLAQAPKVLQQRRASNINVLDFSVHNPNLADTFIALTGQPYCAQHRRSG